MEASRVLQTVARYRWVILLTALCCAALAAAAGWRSGRVYTASVTLKARARDLLAPLDRLVPLRGGVEEEVPTPEGQQAQTEGMVKTVEALAKSPTVLGRAIQRLRLETTAAQLGARVAVREVSPVLLQLSVTDASAPRADQIVGELASSLVAAYAALRSREAQAELAAVREQAEAARRELLQARASTGRDASLRASTAEQNYSDLLRRGQQLRAAGAYLESRAALAVAAQDPAVPAAGDGPLKMALVALLLGALGAATVVVFLEALDRRVRTLDQAEALFGEPVLAVVPSAPATWDARAVATAAAAAPGSAVAGAFQQLALSALRPGLRPAAGGVVLAGLAARPGQGASVAIANLAIALAQAGQRVVLIDGDLRNPSLHEWFELPAGPGLAALAADEEDAARLVVATPVANLSLVSASEGAPNPWAVVRSPRVAAFLAALRQAADFVLINTPPASAGADALALAGQADAALLVFRLRAAPGAPEAALRAALRSAALPVLGMVLNDARAADLRALESPSVARLRPAEVVGPASSYAG